MTEMMRRLHEENETLREEVRQLRTLLGGRPDEILGFDLTTSRMLHAIAAGGDHGSAYERIMQSIYGSRSDGGPDRKILQVLICRNRPLLRLLGISVETVWGWGFRMDVESRGRLASLGNEMSLDLREEEFARRRSVIIGTRDLSSFFSASEITVLRLMAASNSVCQGALLEELVGRRSSKRSVGRLMWELKETLDVLGIEVARFYDARRQLCWKISDAHGDALRALLASDRR